MDGIDLDVPAGGVYGFLGPNGAGKTTTIRILVGLLWPTRGCGRIFGEPVVPGAPVLDRVGSLIERPALYPYLSATRERPGLRDGARPRAGRPRRARVRGARSSRAGVGRPAEGRRVLDRDEAAAGARDALIGRPELVILDEPTNGLDPNGVVDVRELIARLAATGRRSSCRATSCPRWSSCATGWRSSAWAGSSPRARPAISLARGAAVPSLRHAGRGGERAGTARRGAGAPAGGGAPGRRRSSSTPRRRRRSRIARALADAGLYPAELRCGASRSSTSSAS